MPERPEDQSRREERANKEQAGVQPPPVIDSNSEDSSPPEHDAGYGGGRQRAEEFNGQSFGETGWGGSRSGESGKELTDEAKQAPEPALRDYPEGAQPVPDGPAWDERYARENRDKYGQGGGKPVAPRGPSQSEGG